MSRYFFHTENGGSFTDTEGVELPSLMVARNEAIAAASEMLSDLSGALAEGGNWRMDVQDEAGSLCMSIVIFIDGDRL
ncbi:hypothetical protein [Amorphus sp. 3PC139-8]|uniref:DUF6894 family protein n=1 Tax=Amorphus sp. 3PC139-8 TaxID=2735676 RepID=UPI00345D972C